MKLNFASQPLASAARLLLVTASPIQGIVGGHAGKTHDHCNVQGRQILRSDGYEREADLLQQYAEQLANGVAWVDTGWRNTAHYCHPDTRKGLWGWPSAALQGELYLRQAIRLWRQGNREQGMFFLGAAVHLVQDLCVPHHSRMVVFKHHKDFEDWAESHRREYLVEEDGLYNLGKRASDWVLHNARVSYDYYGHVAFGSERAYDQACKVLLSLAQRSTAGFFHNFFQLAEKHKPSNLLAK